MPGVWGQVAEPIHGADVVDPEDPQWRENAFVAFFDPAAEVYGVVHLMTAANAGGRRLRCSLKVGDRQFELVEPLERMSFKNSVVDFDLSGHWWPIPNSSVSTFIWSRGMFSPTTRRRV